MSAFGPQPIVVTFPAGADLSANQYQAVKLNSSGQVVAVAAITDIPIGVLQNQPNAAGKAAEVVVFGGTKMVASAAITLPALVGVDTAGKAKKIAAGTDGTQYILGQAVQAAGASGDLISVYVTGVGAGRAV
jgi:hypothetical protein